MLRTIVIVAAAIICGGGDVKRKRRRRRGEKINVLKPYDLHNHNISPYYVHAFKAIIR
jgi:hypothetical protein